MTAEPELTASLRPVAAAVQIEWSPVVIALTEGGFFCIQPPYVGQAGRLRGHSIHNPQSTGWAGSFQFSSFFVGGGKIGRISIRG